MRTTIRMADDLLKRAKSKAAREGRSLTSVIEEGLRLVLSERRAEPDGAELPVSSATGGVLPGVDLRSGRALADIMDGA